MKPSPPASPRGAAARALRAVLITSFMTIVLFFLLEGASSTVLLLRDLWWDTRPVPRERQHTQYDPLLGWSNRPGARVPDLYGPGKSLTINAEGFRGTAEVGVRVPPGKIRVICSGDSFTLGYGESDEASWCARLAEIEPRLQSVNMGQGGYGADQAYLWYARDGTRLDHDVLIFALIADDFERMRGGEFLGYGKPVLHVRNGTLVTDNVPVPRSSYRFPWLRQHAVHFSRLRTFELIRVLTRDRGTVSRPATGVDPELWKVAAEIFKSLRKLADAKGAVPVLAVLPGPDDYRTASSDAWRGALASEPSLEGYLRVDLVEAIRRLPAGQVAGFFNAYLHYSEAGNRWVAEQLVAALLSEPRFAHKLEERGSPVPATPTAAR
ncbi:MAG TPA: hypothetical protein VFW45_16290 [Candidatus Polarisedimenticolia bacterium]|nr:hypothetical protein [Candidatus Polarisedimenticolia bacterium]